MPYLSRYRTAFASSDLSMPSLHRPALRLACQVLRLAELWLFHVPRGYSSDNLGGAWTPVVSNDPVQIR